MLEPWDERSWMRSIRANSRNVRSEAVMAMRRSPRVSRFRAVIISTAEGASRSAVGRSMKRMLLPTMTCDVVIVLFREKKIGQNC